MSEEVKEDVKELESIFDRVEALVEKAAARVLFPDTDCVKAKICNTNVDLRPLPVTYAKKLGNKLRSILDDAQNARYLDAEELGLTDDPESGSKVPKVTDADKRASAKRWQENSDEVVIDALAECIVVLCTFYDIEGADIKKVQDTMSTGEIKAIVIAQSKINENDDFLLAPLRTILGILSKAQEAVERAVQEANTTELEEKVATIAASVRNGEQASQSSPELTQEAS